MEQLFDFFQRRRDTYWSNQSNCIDFQDTATREVRHKGLFSGFIALIHCRQLARSHQIVPSKISSTRGSRRGGVAVDGKAGVVKRVERTPTAILGHSSSPKGVTAPPHIHLCHSIHIYTMQTYYDQEVRSLSRRCSLLWIHICLRLYRLKDTYQNPTPKP